MPPSEIYDRERDGTETGGVPPSDEVLRHAEKMAQKASGGDSASPTDDDLYNPNGHSGKTDKEDGAGAKNENKQDNPATGAHPDQVGSGFKSRLEGRLNNSKSLKKYIVFGGVGASIIVLIIALFGFLGAFKLDGLMSNIEQRAFLRHNASLNTRSSKYISAYFEARMFDWGDNPDLNKRENTLFRSSRVDTNSPFTDWYRTMRASNFEQEVFEKHGIKFTSVIDADGKIRTGKININGEKPIDVKIPQEDITALENGKIEAFNRYQQYFDLEKYDNNKDARRAIKQVVNENTHWTQVYKRRFLRKSIQNMTGVRNWRFFEKSRDKATAKRIEIRDRVLNKVLPDKGLLGGVTRCLFGLDNCTPSRDVADRKNVPGSGVGLGKENPPTAHDKNIDNPTVNPGDFSEPLKKALSSANIALQIINLPNLLDMITYVDRSLKDLVKIVVIARGAQAAGLFQVFETSRDQIKAGEVNPEEVNALMQNLGAAASSDGWTKVIDGQGDPSATSSKGTCSNKHQAQIQKDPTKYQNEYAPLCANQQIGSTARADQIQTAYSDSIGQIAGPIASAWHDLNSTPIIGQFIGLLRWLAGIINSLISGIIGAILDVLGLTKDVEGAVKWVFGKVADFVGVTILNGYENSGTLLNWILQGGAYTAESTTRQEGGSITTEKSAATAQQNIAQYQIDKTNSMSLYDKVASLSNTDSVAYKGLFALSNMRDNPGGTIASSLHNYWGGLTKTFGSVFSGKLHAITSDGYAASKFAGIETYDPPSQCYTLDPVTMHPLDGTNAMQVLGSPRSYGASFDIDLSKHQTEVDKLNTWDVERDSDSFYTNVYKIIGEEQIGGDDLALQIYNCNLLDTVVRGSLGSLFGYNKDKGVDEVPSPGDTGGPPGTCPVLNTHTPNEAECKWIQYVAQKVLTLLPGSADEKAAMAAQVTWWSLKEGVLDSSAPENPIGYSNCASSGNSYKNFLFDCHESHWQAGLSGVQVQDHDAASVAAKALALHPGKTLDDIIGQVAIEAGYAQGSANYNQAISSTGTLRNSLIIRDPATGFFFSDGAVQPCVNKAGSDWCYGTWDTAQKFAADQQVTTSVISDLTTYFKGFSGATP